MSGVGTLGWSETGPLALGPHVTRRIAEKSRRLDLM
jgi:hypothetical protein